jgi:hypothetical protein
MKKSIFLLFIIAGVLTGCLFTWKEKKRLPLPAPTKHFVAVYKHEVTALHDDGHETIKTIMKTVMSDANGHVRYGDSHDNNWSLHDYKQQVTCEVNNSKQIYTKSDDVGWWDVVEPSLFVTSIPSIGGYQCQYLGMEKVDGYLCKHYAIRYNALMSDKPVGWDEWWSSELNCSVKGGGETLMKYDRVRVTPDLFQIPKTFLLVSNKEFNAQRGRDQ